MLSAGERGCGKKQSPEGCHQSDPGRRSGVRPNVFRQSIGRVVRATWIVGGTGVGGPDIVRTSVEGSKFVRLRVRYVEAGFGVEDRRSPWDVEVLSMAYRA